MLRSILVGLDGSEHSEAALALGIQWATRMDAMVVGLGVISAPEVRRPEMVPIGAGYFKRHSDEARMHRERRRVEGFLERFGLKCAEAEVTFKELEDEGAPHEQIVREAQRYDLILLGQETHFRVAGQDGPCDTLRKVIRDAPRPVVVAPREPSVARTILVAFDGSLQASRALQAFQASGLAGFGPTHVATIGDDHGEAIRHAERAVDFLRQHDILAEEHVLPIGSGISETLLALARELESGLIVMGAYGQPSVQEFFFGSVTRRLLAKSPTPLFVYH